MNSNEEISKFPYPFTKGFVGSNENSFGQPQRVDFFSENVLVFHWIIAYNSYGIINSFETFRDK